jgi:hypothetical protein
MLKIWLVFPHFHGGYGWDKLIVGSSTHHGFYVSSMLFNDTLKTQRISLIKEILEVRTSIRLTNLQFSLLYNFY